MNKFEKISKRNYEDDFDDYALYVLPYEDLELPQRATKYSAGYDFYSPMSVTVLPGQSMVIPTGIKCKLDDDKVLMIYPRSGMGFKYYIRLANTVGVIDADYYNNKKNEGHIFIKVRNEGQNMLEIQAGDAFAQGIITQYFTVENDNSSTVRNGGMGSTDENKDNG